jgi:hypothetical protein
MKPNQLGRFRIENALIQDYPELVMSIMSRMIIVRAEQMWIYDAIEYQAISSDFYEVAKGERIPSYNMLIDSDEGYTGMQKREKSETNLGIQPIQSMGKHKTRFSL